jgi:hypothetical protein
VTSDTDIDAIARLCARAGMIMEDSAPEAIERLPDDLCELDRRLGRLQQAAADISSFIGAAVALRRAL